MLIDEKFRIQTLIEKANESLGSAELLIEESEYEAAVLRCYHAAFFTLRAFLKNHEIWVERTSDSVASFKKYFVDTKKIPVALYDDLLVVLNAGGFDNVVDSQVTDQLMARAVYEKADRFCSEMLDLM